jgi:molybdopterin molybdotransferase
MIAYPDALRKIRTVAGGHRQTQVEWIPLMTAQGRVVAETLLSSEMIPPFDNSAMDGYAVTSSLTQGASSFHPLRLKLRGTIAAGDAPPQLGQIPADEAWEIMTGAPFPLVQGGYDACVRLEDVQILQDTQSGVTEIELRQPVSADQNRRLAGEDFKVGTQIIAQGTRIHPEHLMALSSLGISKIPVYKSPKIGIISTGRELVLADQKPLAGQIRNSNTPYLASALSQLGMDVHLLGNVPDDPEQFSELIQSQIQPGNFDLIVSTGAVSMGKFDFVVEVLKKFEAEIFFQKAAIRPGKPLVFAKFGGGPVFFGLPGNPLACVVGLRFFIEPFLREFLGQRRENPLRARLTHKVKKPEGLSCFYKARMQVSEKGAQANVLKGQLSFMISPLLESTAWAVLSEEGSEVSEGSWIDIYPLHSNDYDWTEKSTGNQNHSLESCCC